MLQCLMIYILDAYNVIHKIPALESKLDTNLRAAREALTSLCGNLAARRGDITQIILVFDGKSEYRDLPQSPPAKIRLVFSETWEEADERIVRILEELPQKIQKWVVSDDNFVRNHARAYEASPMPVAQFRTLSTPSTSQKISRNNRDEAFSLPVKTAEEITAAYKKALGLE